MLNAAEPLARVAVPKAVVDPLSKKLTVPVAVGGPTVAVKVTLIPEFTFVAEGEIEVVVPVRDAPHAVKNASKFIEPRPVTEL